MLDYNTIFFAECQDGNGFLFYFINFAQTQSIFYSRLTSKSIPFCFLCAVVFNRDHCGESCAPSCNPSPSQKTVKNCCPIYKKAAEDTSPMGRILDGVHFMLFDCSVNSIMHFAATQQITATVSAHRSAYSNLAVWRYARSCRCSLPAARPRQRHLPSWQ